MGEVEPYLQPFALPPSPSSTGGSSGKGYQGQCACIRAKDNNSDISAAWALGSFALFSILKGPWVEVSLTVQGRRAVTSK